MSADAHWLDAIMTKYIAGQLARFRSDIEALTHQPVSAVQTDAARLLSDLCRHFGLDEDQHAHVLGESGVRHVEQHYLERYRSQRALPRALGPRADLTDTVKSEILHL
jgi:hypothetical protein